MSFSATSVRQHDIMVIIQSGRVKVTVVGLPMIRSYRVGE